MKKFLLLSILALTFMAKAQTITIGDDTSISSQVPINTLYNYSFTEHLFLADEIEFAGSIKAIRFRIAYSYSTSYDCDIDVYLKHVSKTQFADASDHETFTDDDRVYSGPWTIPADTDGWITIDFDTPFAYNGTDNLVVVLDENSDDFAIRYFMFTETPNAVLSYFSDDENPDPRNLSPFGGFKEISSQRPNIKLVFGGSVDLTENHSKTPAFYPNPAHDILYLDSTEPQHVSTEPQVVSIYDASGRLVLQETVTTQLNISTLTPGLYTLIINHTPSSLLIY